MTCYSFSINRSKYFEILINKYYSEIDKDVISRFLSTINKNCPCKYTELHRHQTFQKMYENKIQNEKQREEMDGEMNFDIDALFGYQNWYKGIIMVYIIKNVKK